MFDVKHVVLTRNPQFAKLSRRISRDNNFIGPNHVGPVIHQRQLATAVWLRIGAGRDSEIPTSSILAACRRVLTLRKNIVDRVHQFRTTLSEAQSEQIEILLSEDRSSQVLMDKTLGSANIIDARNITLLLEEMKKAQIAEYAAVHDEELRRIRATSNQEINDLRKSLSEASDSVAAIQMKMEEAEAQIGAIYGKIAVTANRRIWRERRALTIVAYGFFLVFLAASFFGNVPDVRIRIAAFIIVIILGSIFQFSSSVRTAFLGKFLRDRAHRKLLKTASGFGVDPDEASRRMAYADGEFVLQR